MKKVLHFLLSFLMIFTVAFATVETVDSVPVFANSAKAFACEASNGDLYGYQTAWNNSSLNVTRFNVETGTTFNVKSFTKLGNAKVSKFQNIQASAMDDQGHLFVFGRKNSQIVPYYMASDSNQGIKVGKSVSAGSVIDAATYFEYGGNRYMVAANGFFAGDVTGWTMQSDYNYDGQTTWNTVNFNVETSGVTAKLPRTDDIAWLVDGSSYPALNGVYPSFVGYDIETQKVVLGYITSKVGSTFNITVKQHNLSRSGWSQSERVGAVFAFGGSEVYAIHNGTGNVRKIKYNGSSFSWGSNLGNMTITTSNDGAACHTGTPNQNFAPAASIVAQSSCTGEGKKVTITLSNPEASGKETPSVRFLGQISPPYQAIDRTLAPGDTATIVSTASSNGLVTLSLSATNQSDTSESTTISKSITVDASECITTPTDPDSTFSQSLGTCSGNTSSSTSTSTLSITNNESSATTYYKVEYSLDGGSSYTVKAANLSVAAGQTDTSMTQAVTHGSQIIWRVTDSDISNTFTGQSAEQVSPSAVVGCVLSVNAGETYSACQTLGSDSEGKHKTIMTFYNGEGQTVYLYADIRLSTNGSTWGEWEVRGYQNAISAGESFTRSYGSVPDGQYYQWRWRFGTNVSNLNSASWINGPINGAVDCPTQIGTAVSTSLGACGVNASSKQDITLTVANSGPSAKTSAYYFTQVSINGSDWSETPGSNQEVGVGQTASESWTLGDGDTIDFRYAAQNHPFTETPSSFTDVSFTGGAASLTIDCPSITIDSSVSVTNSSCGATTPGLRPQIFTMTNGSGADTTAYYRVQYNKNSSGWVTAVENQAVDINSSATYTLEDLMIGDTIAWRYNVRNTSYEGETNFVIPTTVSSVPTPGDGCNNAATISSTSLGTCSGASVNSTLSININTYTDNFENGDNISTTPLKYYVQYQIDDGSWTNHTTESAAFGTGSGRNLVNATATFTKAVPDGSTINWRYQAKYDGGDFANIANAPVISANNGEAVECPFINPTASSAIGSCLQSDGSNNDGPATSTFTMQNAGATRNAYFFVEYKINDGDWIEKDTNKQVAKDATQTLTVDVPHGSTITWRYKSSITPRDFSTGSYTTLAESAAVNCPVLVVTATLTPTASCQDGVFTSFLTIQNEDTSNVSGFVQAFYSFDNSTWTAATYSGADVTALEIQDNTAKTLDGVVVPGGTTIYWRYEARAPSASFTNTFTTTGPNSSPLSITADCPYLEPTTSVTLGACSGSSKASTLTVDNSLSNISGFFKVEYRFDDGAWNEAATNDEVAANETATFTVNVPNGNYVTWRYKITDTSNTFTEDYIVTTASEVVACYTTGNSFATHIATGCGYPDATANFNASVPSDVQSAAYFDVYYRTDMGGPFISLGSTIVAPGETVSIGNILVPYGSSIQWMYKVTAEEGADGTYLSTDQLTAQYESNDPCKPDPPVTTTTTIPTIEPIFKPVITNERICNDDGTASFGLSVDNTQSNVSLGMTTLMKIDNVTVVNTNYLVGPGESKFINTVTSVPEGSYYRIKFYVSDGAGGGTSVGVFKKYTDCYKDASDSTTTTTSPPSSTPESEDPQPNCDTEFDGSCDTPLTEEEGNDFIEWDDYDEEIYLTDGSYVVQYFYTEDEVNIASTGIFEDLYILYFVVFSTAGIVLFNWIPRRRKD